MEKLASLIVKKRYGFLGLFIALCIGSVITSNWVSVCDDLTAYLSDDTETHIGLEIMDEEFVTYATAEVMFSNMAYEDALELQKVIEETDGVKSVAFDNTPEHYLEACALMDVTFEGDELDEVSIRALADIEEKFSTYDIYVSSEIGNPTGQILDREMNIVLVIVMVVILAVLLFTSRTWAEIPVLLATFGAAALLNKGSNFMFGEISFITDSIAVVLQLGLAIDYAIILCHRFTEERENASPEDACIAALSKAIPEISASSLTTISGLLALAFMDFGIGLDMSRVLIKAIVLSLMSVFLLMPCLLMIFSPLIDRTHHRSLVPNIEKWGKVTVKSRYIVPPIFAVVLVAAFFLAAKCPYVYGYGNLDTLRQNEVKIAQKRIAEVFPEQNLLALVIPSGDYESEQELVEELGALPAMDHCTALSATEVEDRYTVVSSLTPREFSELADVDIEASRLLYSAYAVEQENYGQIINNLDQYKIPLIEVLKFLHNTIIDEGYVSLDEEQTEKIEDLYEQLTDGEQQLSGANYSRILLYLTLPEESEETYAYLNTIRGIVGKYYTEHYLIGETTKCFDLRSSFLHDNNLITLLSIFFVILVLLFTFKSVGLPALLILVIQGSIYINFSFPYLTKSYMFFLAYLIVSAIQMGANIDYAIVISSRYMELKKEMPYKEAMGKTLNLAFPTIVTSGTILMGAGVAIGFASSENTVSLIGICLGRGTLISILLVLGVLPQILLLGDSLIEKTQIDIHPNISVQNLTGAMHVNGRVRGYISGYVDADIRGIVSGEFNALVSRSAVRVEEPEQISEHSSFGQTIVVPPQGEETTEEKSTVQEEKKNDSEEK